MKYMWLCVAFVPGLLCQISNGAIVSSTFDSDADGWTGVPPITQYSWHGTDGHPGGYLDFANSDVGGTTGIVIAPSKFLGNWTAFDGSGRLQWDAIVFDPGAIPLIGTGWPANKVTISGPGGSATFSSTADNLVWGSWLTVVVPIQQSNWTVDSGTWAGLVADVSDVRIQIERVENQALPDDHTGIDNVTLSSTPVPECSTIVMIGLGFVGIAARRRSS